MATIKRTAELSTFGTLTVEEMREFLADLPADAELNIRVTGGNEISPDLTTFTATSTTESN